jgi:hypothetical protein
MSYHDAFTSIASTLSDSLLTEDYHSFTIYLWPARSKAILNLLVKPLTCLNYSLTDEACSYFFY